MIYIPISSLPKKDLLITKIEFHLQIFLFSPLFPKPIHNKNVAADSFFSLRRSKSGSSLLGLCLLSRILYDAAELGLAGALAALVLIALVAAAASLVARGLLLPAVLAASLAGPVAVALFAVTATLQRPLGQRGVEPRGQLLVVDAEALRPLGQLLSLVVELGAEALGPLDALPKLLVGGGGREADGKRRRGLLGLCWLVGGLVAGFLGGLGLVIVCRGCSCGGGLCGGLLCGLGCLFLFRF